MKRLNAENYKRSLNLVIVGGGTRADEYKQLAILLGIDGKTSFVGPLPQSEAVNYLNQMDIFAALSRRECFGVSLIEAYANEKVCVTSDAPGFLEISENGNLSIVVPANDIKASAEGLYKVVSNYESYAGRLAAQKHAVREKYDIKQTTKMLLKHLVTNQVNEGKQK